MEIPKGFCQCGCGGLAPIAKETCTRKGHRKGEPMKFIHGHNQRGRKNEGVAAKKGHLNRFWKGGRGTDRQGHPRIYCPDHPRAHRSHVAEHILKAEKALGKPLPPKAVVHHHTPAQLVICQDQAYHNLIHQRKRSYEACGKVDWRKCVYCKSYDAPAKLVISGGKRPYHNDCAVQHNKKYREKKRSENANQVSKNI